MDSRIQISVHRSDYAEVAQTKEMIGAGLQDGVRVPIKKVRNRQEKKRGSKRYNHYCSPCKSSCNSEKFYSDQIRGDRHRSNVAQEGYTKLKCLFRGIKKF